MTDNNGWGEHKRLVLSSIDRIEKNIESNMNCMNKKMKDLSDEHHTFKEDTNVEIAKLKTKAGIWTGIISIVISLVISVSATLISYSIINSPKSQVKESINSSDKIESIIEEKVKETLEK